VLLQPSWATYPPHPQPPPCLIPVPLRLPSAPFARRCTMVSVLAPRTHVAQLVPSPEPLERFARLARRRSSLNSLLSQASFSLSCGLAAFVLLLIVGAEILHPIAIIAVLLLAACLGAARFLRTRFEPYPLLQQVDLRLALRDTLSSAFYFGHLHSAGHPTPAQTVLFRQAERFASSLDPAQAVPLTLPRSLYLVALLILAASGLLAVRYRAARQLDLRPPLASLLLAEPTRLSSQAPSQPREQRTTHRFQHLLETLRVMTPPPPSHVPAGADSSPADPLPNEAAFAPPPPDLPNPVPLSIGDQRPSSDSLDASDADSAITANQRAASQSPSRTPQPWDNSHSDLWEKFREALASLLAQLKPHPASSDSQSVQADSRDPSDSARSRPQTSQYGRSAGGRQSAADSSLDADGQQETESLQASRSSSGKPGGRSSDTQPAREGRSGIGKEDGRKDIRETEQLAAMGKLTELFGRRQLNLTGEVTIEVASGPQKVRTPYSEQQASHAEAGGVSYRDEVPLLFQSYVQRYFEQIRKLPPSR